MTYAQIQDAGLENVLQVMDRMASVAGSASNDLISSSERGMYNAEFETLKETLYDLQGTKFHGHYIFQRSQALMAQAFSLSENILNTLL